MDDVDDGFKNRVGADRIESRQVDELIGLARGLIADGVVNQAEVEFLQTWLAANSTLTNQPLIRILFKRVSGILADGIVDDDEKLDLLDTLKGLSDPDIGLGEPLKATTLPLSAPPPAPLLFTGQRYCFTGTFNYGQRKDCSAAATARGAEVGPLTRKTNVLVVGIYATESWKHSAFGDKITQAVKMREDGVPIYIVSEPHWVSFL